MNNVKVAMPYKKIARDRCVLKRSGPRIANWLIRLVIVVYVKEGIFLTLIDNVICSCNILVDKRVRVSIVTVTIMRIIIDIMRKREWGAKAARRVLSGHFLRGRENFAWPMNLLKLITRRVLYLRKYMSRIVNITLLNRESNAFNVLIRMFLR